MREANKNKPPQTRVSRDFVELDSINPIRAKPDGFDRIVNDFMDEMGAVGATGSRSQAEKAVLVNGWASSSVREFLQKSVRPWERALGVRIPLSYEEDKGAGVLNGVLNFTELFVSDVQRFPDIIVGHEAGHCKEAQRAGDSFKDPKWRNDYMGDYIREGFKDSGGYGFPPFSLTRYHQQAQGSLFDEPYSFGFIHSKAVDKNLRYDVGYNVRQIYCDSIPFNEVLKRKRKGQTPFCKNDGQPLTLNDLTKQYTSYLQREYESITTGGSDSTELISNIHISQIPTVARFAASSWALEILSTEIEDVEERNERTSELRSLGGRFLRLFGHQTVSNEEMLDIRDTPNTRQDEITREKWRRYACPEDPVSARSGLSENELMGIIVLIRAYKRHFIASICQDQFVNDDDLRPHIERLRTGTESEKKNTLRLLGDIGTPKAISGIAVETDDGIRRYGLKDFVFDTRNSESLIDIGLYAIAGIKGEQSSKALREVAERHPHSGVRFWTTYVIDRNEGRLSHRMMRDKNEVARMQAASVYNDVGNETDLPDLERGLKSWDKYVRLHCAEAIENLQSNKAEPIILRGLKRGGGYRERNHLVLALRSCETKQSMRAAIKVLQNDYNAVTRGCAAHTLGDLRDPDALPFLRHSADVERFKSDYMPGTRVVEAALVAIEKIEKNPRTLPESEYYSGRFSGFIDFFKRLTGIRSNP